MVSIVISLVGGLGLFIYGMNLMSRGIERVAGNKLRDVLKAFTRNKFLGLIVGLFFTAVIQSSSAATVMVVSFVNSGLMTLAEASGVIMGANIGTTVTALLVAFQLSAIAPIFIFIGAVMAFYIKNVTVRKSGDIVLGFGLLFLGISLMSQSMGKLRDIPAVIEALGSLTNPFLGVLLGLVITSVVQSSSVTVSILVVMAGQGLVDLHTAFYFILGCNIGACTSAVITALSGSKNAKRAALIHLLFNIFGSILLFVLISLIPDVVENVILAISGRGDSVANLGRNIAIAHLSFKVFMVIVFYPLMGLIIKLTHVLVPGEDGEEGGFSTRFISSANPNPAIAVYLGVQEIYRMGHMAIDNLNLGLQCMLEGKTEDLNKIEETEAYIDYLNIKISEYLVKINENSLPISDQNKISGYFHAVSDLERIGDYADNFREYTLQMQENNIKFSEESVKGLQDMVSVINEMFDYAMQMFGDRNDYTHMREIQWLEDYTDKMERELMDQHFERLGQRVDSPEEGVYFSDSVSALERVADHLINIAFALDAGRKQEKAARIESEYNVG